MATKKTAKAAPKATKTKAPPQSAPAEKVKAPRVDKVAKTELIELISDKTGLTKKRAGDAVDVVLEEILGALKAGGTVGLPGVGSLSVVETRARQGVRPGTNEKIAIPAGKKVRFKIASTLKADL